MSTLSWVSDPRGWLRDLLAVLRTLGRGSLLDGWRLWTGLHRSRFLLPPPIDVATYGPVTLMGALTFDATSTDTELISEPAALRASLQAMAAVAGLRLFTYRRDFVPFAQTTLTTDAGWGCMIRTAQMILAAAYDRATGTPAPVSWFDDTPEAPFSIHRLVALSGQPAGAWWSPAVMCHTLARMCHTLTRDTCHTQTQILNPNTAPTAAAASAATSRRPGEPGPPPALRALVAVDGQVSRAAAHAATPFLLLVATRWALDLFPADRAGPVLRRALALPSSLGIAGGPPRMSSYIVGVQGQDAALYLDPHVIHVAGETLEPPMARRLPLTLLDPCMAFAFWIRALADIEAIAADTGLVALTA